MKPAKTNQVIFAAGRVYKILTDGYVSSNYADGSVWLASAYTWIKSKNEWSKTAPVRQFSEYVVMNNKEIAELGS